MTGDLVLVLAAVGAGAALTQVIRRRAPDVVRRQSRGFTDVVALVATVGSVFAHAAPTGLAAVDVALRAGFVAVVTASAARARREPVLVASAIAAVGSAGSTAAILLAFGALGSEVAGAVARRRSRVLGAVAGGLLANALLHLAWPRDELATALLAGLAATVVCASALRRLGRRDRRRVLAVVGASTVLVLTATGAAAWVAADQREEIEQAQRDFEQGVAEVRRGDTDAAAEHLGAASAAVDRTLVRLDAWWMQPARAVPVVAQHLDASRRALGAVREAADAVVDATQLLALDRIRSSDGVIDVDALRAARPPVDRAGQAAAQAQTVAVEARSPWLMAPLDDALDELATLAAEAEADAFGASEALEMLPGVLGADEPRQWLVLVATPSELRGGGGFVGSWAVLRIDRGRMTLPVVERSATIAALASHHVSVDAEYDAAYVERWGLDRFFQNVTASPHLPSTASAAVQMVEPLGLGRFDGVVVVDPFAIAGLLELTGPITVPWWPQPITSQNAPRILLHDQYQRAGDADRVDFLEAVTRTVFDQLATGPLPGLGRIADVLGPLARQGRIQLHAFDPDVDAWIGRIGASSDLVAPTVDGIGVVDADRVASKLGYFLRRQISYEVTVDPVTGKAIAEVVVTVTNVADDVPSNGYFGRDGGGESGLGTMSQAQALYSVLPVVDVQLDGTPQGGITFAERSYTATESYFTVAPGQQRTLRYRLEGTLPITAGQYRLDVHRQPTVAPDELRVAVNGDVLFEGAHVHDLVLQADLRDTGQPG